MTGKPLQPVNSPFDGDTGNYLQKRIKAGKSLLMGIMIAPEPFKEIDDSNAIRIVFGTTGEYPDGTKWERNATADEIAQYENFCR